MALAYIAIFLHFEFYCGNLEVFRGNLAYPWLDEEPNYMFNFLSQFRRGIVEKMASEYDAPISH